MTDTASAQKAIDEILEQGEGPRGHWRNAHFGQFVEILDEYLQLRDANPAFDPVRPVVTVNVRPSERDTGVPLVTDPLTSQVMDLFNVSYEVLLLMLQRFFAHTEETDAQLKALADATVNLMFGAIKPLGDLVTTLPAGPEYPGRTAGPSFELFYESDYLLPHREAAWIMLTERIRQAAAFCEPGVPCAPTIAGSLDTVRSSLNDIAAALEAHMPARDIHLAEQDQAPAEVPASLLSRAEDFYRTGTGSSVRDHPAQPALTALLTSAYQAVQAADPHPHPPSRKRPAPPKRGPDPAPRHPRHPHNSRYPRHPRNPRNPTRHFNPTSPIRIIHPRGRFRPSRLPVGPRDGRDHAAGPPRYRRPARPARGDRGPAGAGLRRGDSGGTGPADRGPRGPAARRPAGRS